MYNYEPKYVREVLNYQAGEIVKHGDYNRNLNLLNVAVDNNTEALKHLLNTGDLASINALKLDGAELRRHREHILEDNDELVPSSKAVYQHVEGIRDTFQTALNTINTTLGGHALEMFNINKRIEVVNSLMTQYGERADYIERLAADLEKEFEFTHGTLHGGRAGQVLGKLSDDDLDYTWLDRIQGPPGEPGYTPIKGVDYFDGEQGPQGEPGYTPIKGVDYFDGQDGKSIVSVTKSNSSGLVDTYTITYSDDTTSTFNITNGKDGEGTGDMLASMYDPNNVNSDAFNMDNMIDGTTYVKTENNYTDEEKQKLSNIEENANNYVLEFHGNEKHIEDSNHRTVTDTEKESWNNKFDKTGGTITGDVSITGQLQVNGGKVLNILEIYPIGSIYMSVNSTNPGTLFGGTWERFGQGRVLVGVDTSQTEFNTVEKTGGEKTHTLTVNEIPSHKHSASTNSTGAHRHNIAGVATRVAGTWNGVVASANASDTNWTAMSSTGEHTHTVTIGDTGGGQAHNNLQPYITCYMWKRIA